MKPIKMLGLALVAALATMALLGTGSASAKVALCLHEEEPCAGPQWGKGTVIEATQSSQTTKLKDESVFGTKEVQCQKSALHGELIEKIDEEQQWKGEIPKLGASWSECKLVNAAQEVKGQCTVTPLQLPWVFHIEQTGAAGEYKGILWTEPSENAEKKSNGQPGAEIACEGQPTITEKAKETQLEGTKQEGFKEEAISAEITSKPQPAQIILNQKPLKDNLIIPGQGFWTETYTVVKPTEPMYVTQG